MGDDGQQLNVPIRVRTQELGQLHEFVPATCADLQRAEMYDRADDVQRIYDEYIAGTEATYPDGEKFANWVSMPAEDWQQVIRGLGRLRRTHGLRLYWLRTKLVKRLRERMEEME